VKLLDRRFGAARLREEMLDLLAAVCAAAVDRLVIDDAEELLYLPPAFDRDLRQRWEPRLTE
jgi:hypothetical protein